MKRYIVILLAIMTSAFIVHSEEFEIEHYSFDQDYGMDRSCILTLKTMENIPDAVEIIYYKGPTDGLGFLKRLEIPSKVTNDGKEYKIESINATFYGVEEIHIPNTVRFIKQKLGTHLKEVTIDNAPVEMLSNGVFQWSSHLTHISFGDNCRLDTIPSNCFAYCSALTDITLPKSIKVIEKEAFRSCSLLTSCIIDRSVEKIGAFAFSECSSLTDIELPESLQEIGWSAFSSCNSLERVKMFPVNHLGTDVFLDCSNLKTVNISTNSHENRFGLSEGMFKNCNSLKEFICSPETISQLSNDAFANCISLESFSLSPNTEIWGNPFTGCTGLESITVEGEVENPTIYSVDGVLFGTLTGNSLLIYPAGKKDVNFTVPDEVYAIESGAFEGNPHIKNVTLGKEISDLRDKAFKDCINLSVVKNTENLRSIGNQSFAGAESLVEFDLGDKLEVIGAEAFKDAISLKKVTGGMNVNEISNSAFSGASSLQEITGFTNLKIIGDNVFENATSLSVASLGTALDEMGVMVFKGCNSLKKVSLPETLDYIPSGTFTGCSSLESIELPLGCKYIGKSSFAECEALSAPLLPDAISVIGESAFSGCKSIESISLPANLKELRPNTFRDCTSLSAIQLNDNLVSIQRASLQGCSGLSEITFPKSITAIEERSFKGCDNLKQVVIPEAVVTLGIGAFEDCSNLYTVITGNGLTEIGTWAFSNCVNLESITLGSSLETIGDQAFEGDLNIREIICLNPEPPAYSTGFPDEVLDKATVIVPSGSEDIYNSSLVWAPMVDGTDKVPDTVIPIEVILFETTALTLNIDDRTLIRKSVFPENATDTEILWSSSNESVASVDENGEVTALTAGTTLITATTNGNSDVKAECRINVVYDAADVIEIIFSDTNTIADIYRLDGTLAVKGCHMEDLSRLHAGFYIIRTPKSVYKLHIP